MKRHIVLVLLVPILALTLISCDGDVSSGFAKFLGNFGGNVYIDGGLVEANKADVKAATSTIAGLGSGEGVKDFDETDTKTDTFGIEVGIPVGVTTVMKPQPKADQDKLKSDLANAMTSTQQSAALKEELKKPVTDPERIAAANGTVEVFNAAITALKDEIGTSSMDENIKDAIDNLKLDPLGSTITEGDILMVQLMTDLVSNTIETLEGIAGGGTLGNNLNFKENSDSFLSIFGDAQFAAKVASNLVGVSGYDFLEGLNPDDLIPKGSKQNRNGLLVGQED